MKCRLLKRLLDHPMKTGHIDIWGPSRSPIPPPPVGHGGLSPQCVGTLLSA